jgi:hypothetical protein
MGTNDVLRSTLRHTHDDLAARLGVAEAMQAPPGQPRHDRQRIDEFLAATSKHLHAVDAVLVPTASKRVPEGRALVHAYLRTVKDLEVELAHVKAHEYGSVYESAFAWPAVWSDVEAALREQWHGEEMLAERLTEALPDEQLDRLTDDLGAAEATAPSRPHPFTPHTGLLGRVGRRVMHAADGFWDTVEGRMVPERARPPKPPPGRFAQYFLADPRFDEEER